MSFIVILIVYFHLFWEQPFSKLVLATQLQDKKIRVEILERRDNTRLAAFGGFAADTGVNYAMFVTLGLQPGLQQSCPRLVNIYSRITSYNVCYTKLLRICVRLPTLATWTWNG